MPIKYEVMKCVSVLPLNICTFMWYKGRGHVDFEQFVLIDAQYHIFCRGKRKKNEYSKLTSNSYSNTRVGYKNIKSFIFIILTKKGHGIVMSGMGSGNDEWHQDKRKRACKI